MSKLVQNFGIDTVTTNGKVIPGIKRMFDIALELKDSVMLHGAPGIGKSQAVYQWNKAKAEADPTWNPDICDVRLSMKEPVDLIGIPIPTIGADNKQETVWATPKMWPKENGKYTGGTILLDEINQGQPSILNAAFQLIQDRALGDYKVPDGYIIIAAGNPSLYNNTVSEMSLPLCNRFSHFNVKPDFDSWLNYRLNNGGNPDVISFLKTQDSSLLFDTKSFESRIGSLDDADFTDILATPRSWEVVERLLDLKDFTTDEKMYYATGRLGLSLAVRFFNYLKDKAEYQSWEDILVNHHNFKSETSNVFFAVQLNCLSAIAMCKDDSTCRKYVLNFLDATRHLNSKAFKTINITSLNNLERLKGKKDIYCLTKDAMDLVQLLAENLFEGE